MTDAPTRDELDLTTETDASLDANLLRLYVVHRQAEGQVKADAHAQIMDVLGEQSARLAEWVAQWDARHSPTPVA